MAKKDKFAQMQQSGGVGSFQESLVEAAATVAAIERKQEDQTKPESASLRITAVAQRQTGGEWQPIEPPRFMRLPNPQITVGEYNLVSQYCNSLANMTRQDWVELAIVEKLHNDNMISDEDFHTRQFEIRNRPTRGQRRNTKVLRQEAISPTVKND